MADKEFIFEIKANISGLEKDLKKSKEETQELKDNFGAFGITVGSVKEKFKEFRQIVANGFKQIAIQSKLAMNGFKLMFGGEVRTGAKVLFNVIKTGVAATGIGLLVVAFASLVSFLTKTKKGAELLERTFTGLGAAVSVIVDRVSKFGGAIVKLFQGDTKGALQDVKGAFKGIGDEIQREVDLMIELKRQSQELRDSERELRVETAERRAEIEGLKLIAEDLTKTEEERLDAAQKAFDIENELLDKRVANAEEAVRIQKEQVETSESLEEDLDKLADLEVALADIRIESTTKQIELNNKINGIKREAEAKEIQALKDLIALDKERVGTLEEVATTFEQSMDKQMDKIGELFEATQIDFEKKKDIEMSLQELSEQRIEWAAMSENERLELAKHTLNNLTTIMGEESKAGKAAAIAATTIDTYQSATAAYKSLAGIPVVGPALGAVAAAAAVTSGLANVRAIASTGEGGGSVPSAPNTPSVAAPRTELTGGAFTLEGGVEPEPARAFVVSDDITDSQNKLANIRRRATI